MGLLGLIGFVALLLASQIGLGPIGAAPAAGVGSSIAEPRDMPLARRDLPRFANIAGALVGRDGFSKLERKLGRGASVTGGHPQGARVWKDVRNQWMVYIDGFYYCHNDSIIDQLTVTEKTPWTQRGIPRCTIRPASRGL